MKRRLRWNILPLRIASHAVGLFGWLALAFFFVLMELNGGELLIHNRTFPFEALGDWIGVSIGLAVTGTALVLDWLHGRRKP